MNTEITRSLSILVLIKLRNAIKEQYILGKIDIYKEKAKEKAEAIEGLLLNIFGNRRFNIPIVVPTEDMSFKQISIIIEDAIHIIDIENPSLFTYNYNNELDITDI